MITEKSFKIKNYSPEEAIRPRLWQERLINLIRRRLEMNSGTEKDLLVYAGPGAGKTLGALLSFKAMQKEKQFNYFLVFCHRNSIIHQWEQTSRKLGLILKDCDASFDTIENKKSIDGLAITYQGAVKNSANLLKYLKHWEEEGFIAIADEVHHLGINNEESKGHVWGRAFNKITVRSKLNIGLTGTPFRADNLSFCSARQIQVPDKGKLISLIRPDLCIEPRELISTGDLRPLEFHFQDGWIEHGYKDNPNNEVSLLSTENRESWRARNLRRAIHLSDKSSIAIQLLLRAREKLQKIRSVHKTAAGLVIAKDIAHAKAIKTVLKENGDQVDLVHSYDPDAKERLKSFQKSNAKWLVSVDMCTEGFDAPRLRVIAYLTTIVTESRFLQSITRAVRVCSERAKKEKIPRNPSYIFAPADHHLMSYARSWSKAKPYLISNNHPNSQQQDLSAYCQIPGLSLETFNAKAGETIRIRTAELPNFL